MQVESLQTRLALILKEIDSSEDVLNLRLENIQVSRFRDALMSLSK